MNITIEFLRETERQRWLLEITVGRHRLESAIREMIDGVLEGFAIENPCVKDVFALTGLEGRFARDFFEYKVKHEPSLPWDYGRQDEATMTMVLAHHGVK